MGINTVSVLRENKCYLKVLKQKKPREKEIS